MPKKRKYNKKAKNNTPNKDKPSRITRSKISDLATEYLERGSDEDI